MPMIILVAGTMTFWLYVAGHLYGDISASIPYGNLATGLSLIAVPCLLGVAVRYKKPKIADFISRLVKVLCVVFIVWMIVAGSIANYYIFSLMVQRWYILPAAMMLPYMGAALGAFIAYLFRQPRARIVAIGIETGVQDTGVAILLLLTSFGRPDGQIASVVPIATAMFTPIPFAIIATIRTIYTKCWLGGRCTRLGGPEHRKLKDVKNSTNNGAIGTNNCDAVRDVGREKDGGGFGCIELGGVAQVTDGLLHNATKSGR